MIEFQRTAVAIASFCRHVTTSSTYLAVDAHLCVESTSSWWRWVEESTPRSSVMFHSSSSSIRSKVPSHDNIQVNSRN